MRRGSIFGLLVGLAVTIAHAATGEQWVAVASYSSQSRAERGMELLEQQVSERLSVVEDTASVLPRFRVLAGPYADRELAVTARSALQAAGITDAWILPADAAIGASDFSSAADDPWAYDYSAELDDDLELAPRSELAPREKQTRTLVDEAPEDYSLHRLRRR